MDVSIETGLKCLCIQYDRDAIQRLSICFASVFGFSLFAYATRYFETFFSHDSLEVFMSNQEAAWQISLGRWAQPLLWAIRGYANNPWLIGLIAILFTALTVWLLTDTLRIREPIKVALVCGIITTAIPMVLVQATFHSWVDVYAIAMYLSVLSVWLCVRGGDARC